MNDLPIEIYIYIHCCLIVKELSEEQGHVRKC